MANDKEAIDPDDCPRLTKIAELMNRLYEYSGDFTDADVHAALSDAYDAGFDAARPEWVRVSERLPDKEGDYLVAFQWGQVMNDGLVQVQSSEKEILVDTDYYRPKHGWEKHARPIYERVRIAWMPIPPFEEESEPLTKERLLKMTPHELGELPWGQVRDVLQGKEQTND